MSKGTRRRNSQRINICVSLYSFSVIVGVLLQRLVSPFNFTSMSSPRHFITYFLGSFFLSCVCVCVSVRFSVHVCICANECACVRGRCRSQKDFDVFPATFCQKSAVWLRSAQGLPALSCEHTHLHLPSTPSIQAVSTRLHLPSIPSTGVAHTPTLAFVLVPGL